MKKLLLVLLILPFFGFSQQLSSFDFNSLTPGNIKGQLGWDTQISNGAPPTTSNNASEENLQVTANGKNSTQGFTLTGPNGDMGGSFVWNDGLPAAWASRTSGNDIIEVEVSVNPGDLGSSSLNNFGVYIYDPSYTKVLAGFRIDESTNKLFLVAYSLPTGQLTPGNFRYDLDIVVAPNMFSTYGISYNTITGQVLIDGDGIDGPLGLPITTQPDVPTEIDFVAFSGSTQTVPNTMASSITFDNYIVRASATNTLLGVAEFATNVTSLYPNPATNEINLKSISAIQKVQLYNSLGQVVIERTTNLVKEVKFDISDLGGGMYFINIKSEDGKIETKKFIKK
ncbi:hypothetical protein A9996_11270 [Gelidibacter algens]|nr:hypothetical protein A9996_11270 [Gelidibacter algens]